jgi:hypothetical protein
MEVGGAARRQRREAGQMKAAVWHFLGASSLAWAAGVASAVTPMETALHTPELVDEVNSAETTETASIIHDAQIEATAYNGGRGDCCEGDCADECGDLCRSLCAPTWKVRAGAVILTRSRPDQVVLARPIGGLIQISGGEDFDFGYAGGPDISIERRLGDGPNSVEVRYFGALNWNAAYDYGATGDIQIGPINIPLAFDVTANYQSKLNSTEFNFRHQRSDRVTWLTGFRIIELNEQLDYNVDFIVPNLSGVSWNTSNHLYGGQVGADVAFWRLSGPLSVNGLFKAGIYGNDAENDFTFRVLDTPIIEGGASDNPVAFVGEIGATTAYQVTRHFAVRGGYQLLWISDVALASDQAQAMIDTLDVNAMNSSGDVFYHGAMAGGEFTW